MHISLHKNENLSPYLIDIAHKILMHDFGWGGATREDVMLWLGEHKDVFTQAYALASRNDDDDNACVRAAIDAVLDDEENAVTDAEIAMSEGMDTSLSEICDSLNRYACARKMPYKADLLGSGDTRHISLHDNRRYLDISYNKDKSLEVYKSADMVGHPSHTFAQWDTMIEITARLLGIMDRYAKTEGMVRHPAAHAFRMAANAVRDFLATYLRNELVNKVDLDYAVRTYDDIYPYVEVVDKDLPDNGSYLTAYVYSPLGDGNFKIAYRYYGHPSERMDCPADVPGLEKAARTLANTVLNPVHESAYEKLSYEKGHKNSKGEDAPWVIRSHSDGRVLASFAKKTDAEKHLARMKGYADKE